MPTYEYKCKICGYKFEKFQNISDEPLKKCPKCDKAVKRIISAGIGVIMRGRDSYSSDEKKNNLSSGKTCCGRTERCDTPPCSDDGVCKR